MKKKKNSNFENSKHRGEIINKAISKIRSFSQKEKKFYSVVSLNESHRGQETGFRIRD